MHDDDQNEDRRAADWEDARDEERAREGGHVGGTVPLSAEAPRRSCAPRTYQRADHRIRDDIYDALCGETGADASDVTVAVHGGAVTLTGAVPESEDERRVVRVAERVAGVRRVVNYLRVLAPA
jgi:hyperosmotically inducible protein